MAQVKLVVFGDQSDKIDRYSIGMKAELLFAYFNSVTKSKELNYKFGNRNLTIPLEKSHPFLKPSSSVTHDKISLSLTDTTGTIPFTILIHLDEEDNNLLYQNSLSKAQIILLVYSVIDPKSFEAVQSKVAFLHLLSHVQYLPAIQKYEPGTPTILVGLRTENRYNVEVWEELGHKASVVTYMQVMEAHFPC